jgi:O-succinylbenzoate synthase
MIAARAIAALVLKPTVLGPARTLALAGAARRAGVPAVLSHALEGPIGMAADIELALALGAGAIGALAVGLDAHPGLSAWKVLVPTLGPASLDDVPRAGTGLDLDRALERARMLA